jgi:hypothetical protein
LTGFTSSSSEVTALTPPSDAADAAFSAAAFSAEAFSAAALASASAFAFASAATFASAAAFEMPPKVSHKGCLGVTSFCDML